MRDELYMAETFFPTVVVDTESDYYKSLKPVRQCLLRTRIKRGPGKGRLRGAWLDTLAQLFRSPEQ